MSKKNEIVAEKQTLPAVRHAIDFGADAGSGMEGASRESFAVPFLSVLQKISPQCDEADAKFVDGAKGGMLFNSVTGKTYDGKTGCEFLPAAYQRRYLRWGPRGESSAGFKGEMMPEAVSELLAQGLLVEQDSRLYFPLEDGSVNDKKCDRLADVRNHFGVLIEPDGSYTQALLTLGSTQIKKSKLLMSMLSAVKVKSGDKVVTPPTWANKVRITTVLESNDKGSWYGVKFELNGFVGDKEQYEAAKAFHSIIASGDTAPVNYAEAEVREGSDKF